MTRITKRRNGISAIKRTYYTKKEYEMMEHRIEEGTDDLIQHELLISRVKEERDFIRKKTKMVLKAMIVSLKRQGLEQQKTAAKLNKCLLSLMSHLYNQNKEMVDNKFSKYKRLLCQELEDISDDNRESIEFTDAWSSPSGVTGSSEQVRCFANYMMDQDETLTRLIKDIFLEDMEDYISQLEEHTEEIHRMLKEGQSVLGAVDYLRSRGILEREC